MRGLERFSGPALIVLAIAAPAATAQTVAPVAAQDEIVGSVGQPITLDNEQIHTVVQVERWYGGGYWLPKAADAAVTLEIKVQAIAKTSYNPMYYSIRDASGKTYGRVILGYRYESLGSSASMGARHRGDRMAHVPRARKQAERAHPRVQHAPRLRLDSSGTSGRGPGQPDGPAGAVGHDAG